MIGAKRSYSWLLDNCHQFCAGCFTGDFDNSNNFLWMLKDCAKKHLRADNWRHWDVDEIAAICVPKVEVSKGKKGAQGSAARKKASKGAPGKAAVRKSPAKAAKVAPAKATDKVRSKKAPMTKAAPKKAAGTKPAGKKTIARAAANKRLSASKKASVKAAGPAKK